MSKLTLDELRNARFYLQIDEDGYFNAQGVKIEDEEAGQELYSNLQQVQDARTWYTEMDGTKALVEAYNAPYVVHSINPSKQTTWEITMPYGFKSNFNLQTLTLDEWDRIHGFDTKHIPFVLSRNAQNDFFNAVDSFDDDSFTFLNKNYPLKEWLSTQSEQENHVDEKSWNSRYEAKDTPWDQGQVLPVFKDILPQIKINKCRVLVLGCGMGHDAAHFAQAGHIVTAIDFSELAIQQAKALYGHIKNLNFAKADALKLPKEFHEQFDLVVEHTLYCAIDVKNRNALVQSWRQALVPKGNLLAILFAVETRDGPPFGGSEWEIKARLEKHFDFLYWTRWKNSTPRRHGTELVVYAEKKNSI